MTKIFVRDFLKAIIQIRFLFINYFVKARLLGFV